MFCFIVFGDGNPDFCQEVTLIKEKKKDRLKYAKSISTILIDPNLETVYFMILG